MKIKTNFWFQRLQTFLTGMFIILKDQVNYSLTNECVSYTQNTYCFFKYQDLSIYHKISYPTNEKVPNKQQDSANEYYEKYSHCFSQICFLYNCTYICQISYNDDESSVDESLLEVASASVSMLLGKVPSGAATVTNIMPSIVHYLSAVHYEDQCSIRRHCAPEWNNREQQLCR